MNENENAGKNASPASPDTESARDNENNRLHSGALRSSLTIELHTRHAIQLWQGREGHEKRKGEKGAGEGASGALSVCRSFFISSLS